MGQLLLLLSQAPLLSEQNWRAAARVPPEKCKPKGCVREGYVDNTDALAYHYINLRSVAVASGLRLDVYGKLNAAARNIGF